MRIFALVTDAFGGEGGIAQYNRDFFSAFAKAHPDGRVIVLPLLARKDVHELPSNVYQKRSALGRLRYALTAFTTVGLEGPFDLIFCAHLHLAPLAALLAHVFRLPLWINLHGIEAWKKPTTAARWAVEHATLVTAVSRYTRRKFLGWANLPPYRVRVLPNTVRNKFTPGPKVEKLIGRYRLQGKKVLLTTGRLSAKEQYKGHDKVISMLPDLLQKHPRMVYIIAGEGDDRSRLETLAKEKGVNESVLFVGKVDDREIVDLYRTADLFVMPSTGEGFGIVFLEAMACGIPVVGGIEDGSTDPLQDGMLGAAVPNNRLVEAVVEGLITAIRDRDELSEAVQKHFGEAAFAKQLAKLAAMCVAA